MLRLPPRRTSWLENLRGRARPLLGAPPRWTTLASTLNTRDGGGCSLQRGSGQPHSRTRQPALFHRVPSGVCGVEQGPLWAARVHVVVELPDAVQHAPHPATLAPLMSYSCLDSAVSGDAASRPAQNHF